MAQNQGQPLIIAARLGPFGSRTDAFDPAMQCAGRPTSQGGKFRFLFGLDRGATAGVTFIHAFGKNPSVSGVPSLRWPKAIRS